MIWEVRRFLDIFRDEGLHEALSRSYQYIKLDWLGMTNKLRYEFPDELLRPIFDQRHGSGIDVANREWDNLIVLDSYRYDYFREHSRFNGELSKVVSKGNWSLEWVVGNFRGADLTDTVCVSGNVFYERLNENTLFVLESLGRDPEVITQTALQMHERYPDKRLIVHYMTPHQPHRGETAKRLADGDDEFASVFELYGQGVITKETVRQSYREAIEIAESHAERLVGELEGKTVITADHGENLGEVSLGLERVGHGHETKECRFVPWMELPCDERKTVTSEEPLGFDYSDDGVVRDRLEDLGYL